MFTTDDSITERITGLRFYVHHLSKQVTCQNRKFPPIINRYKRIAPSALDKSLATTITTITPRATIMRSHGLFAQFDDELQDSDQTISPPVRHLHPYARPSTVADATNSSSSDRASPSRRRFPTSAFFSDTTDDDVSRPTSGLMDHSIGSYSRFSNRRRSQGRQNSVSHGLRLRVDAIQFPMTRSVLWYVLKRRIRGDVGVFCQR